MLIPKPLKPGDTVAMIALSSCVPGAADRERVVLESAAKLERQGFHVRIDPTCYTQWGHFAGTDEQRAEALNNAFRDDSIDGVWCIRGGYGCIRLPQMIDWDMVATHPKAFVGYSDVTTIHSAMHQKAQLCTFHGPMPKSDSFMGPSLDSIMHAVSGTPDRSLINFDGTTPECLREGVAEGMLVGGNLCLVATSMGTPYALDTTGKILFLEDIGEMIYSIDRYLQQLYLAGCFDRCAGVVFGGFTDCKLDFEGDTTMEEVLQQLAAKLHVPVMKGLQCGHLKESLTLCLGRRYRMDAAKGTLELID